MPTVPVRLGIWGEFKMKYAMFVGALLAASPGASYSQDLTHRVHFEISCGDEAQAEFNRGVELLHSFEYPATIRIFSELLQRQPDCGMARWGIAMSLWHPLWAPPTADVLDQGMHVLADADIASVTPRERAYLEAAQAFFSSNDVNTHSARASAFEVAMADLYANHLNDPEAAVFYALALRATADPRDKSYANQFHAAGILNWVGETRPEHPGVLHYTIHSYDYPGLAHLALPAALAYARTAPDSAHAQHMPSHIFTRLGMWDRSLASNHDATRSAEAFTQQAGLPGHYDEGLHSMDYLMYAMLQSARDEDAAQLLSRLNDIDRTNVENFKVAFTYAAAPARYAIERREWDDAARMELSHPAFPWAEFPWAEAIHHFARGLGAARSGDVELANAQLIELGTLQDALAPATPPYWREEVQVQIDALGSWIAFAGGQLDEAIALAQAAADREDAVDKHPVTPGEIIPARELLAEMLLLSGDHRGALAQYEEVLRGSPYRLNALLGAARSAEAAGRLENAAAFRRQADDQTDGRYSARNW